MIPKWVSEYVGIPFVEEGSSRTGSNCWGLCHLILKEQAGIDTPSYTEKEASAVANKAIKQIRDAHVFRAAITEDEIWNKVEEPRLFDCLLMASMSSDVRAKRVPCHVGLMLNAKQVIHVWSATDSVVMPINHMAIRHSVIAFYRHKDLP